MRTNTHAPTDKHTRTHAHPPTHARTHAGALLDVETLTAQQISALLGPGRAQEPGEAAPPPGASGGGGGTGAKVRALQCWY